MLFHSFFKIILDFVYPPFCYLCENQLGPEEDLFCQDCWQKQENIKSVYLPVGKMPYIPGPHKWISGSFACFQYSEITQEFIHLFKYKKFEHLSVSFGSQLAKVLKNSNSDVVFDVLVPIPLHKKRLKERGFNQSQLLAKSISEKSGIPLHSDLLCRNRYTLPQAKMNRDERIENVKGAFQFTNSPNLKGKTVLLVDDVLTTGSTMNECARVLKNGGAKDVFCLTITRI